MDREKDSFQRGIQNSYQDLLEQSNAAIPGHERLKIDLHCHDENSNVTDELWGRIMRVPETWITTEELLHSLKSNHCRGITITNHNNARSCWKLLERGEDILVGAEFSCHVPEYNIKLHVLAYGFTPEQEAKLNRYRRNLYQFMTYAAENDLPTILPHPLYFHTPGTDPGMELFEKLALLFERFEVANGQRNTWQNLLIWEWLEGLTEEKIDAWSKKHGLDPKNFCKNPYRKIYTGGSDDHMAVFAGTCGSYIHVPDLEERLRWEKPSDIVLEGLREGNISPFGYVANHEKLNVSLLDYLSQLTLNMKEPGLFRMFLHHGSLKDKLFCLGASNIIHELKRHRFTVYFFRTLHDALNGKRPGLLSRFRVSPDFKPILMKIDEIAKSRHHNHALYLKTVKTAVPAIFERLNAIIAKRIKGNEEIAGAFNTEFNLDTQTLIKRFEIPSHFRSLFEEEIDNDYDHVTQVNISTFFDQLSFPVLASAIIAGSSLISTRSLYGNRKILNEFANSIGRHEHPKRLLWLTDTLKDKNGVSGSLSARLDFVRQYDLPVDFLICSNDIEQQDHLKVVPAVGRFSFPNYREQPINVPNILEIKRLFMEGGYDRIICSTEFVMGLVTLYLKASFNVPVYFFLHTDWMEFIRDTTQLDSSALDRIRRILRFFYRNYDGIFVLNKDHRDWLVSNEIQIPRDNVHLTSHWVSKQFQPADRRPLDVFGNAVEEDDFVLLYAGRLSEEKGVLELADIYRKLKQKQPGAKLAVAGIGPTEEKLRQAVPGAIFLGWVDKEKMPDLYSASSMLVLPSRFDTFGNVVLEAMSCGLPVAAYRTKGPKEIIESSKCGILADTLEELGEKIARTGSNRNLLNSMKRHALQRVEYFSREKIMSRFLEDIGLQGEYNISMKEKTVKRKVRTEESAAGQALKQAV